MGAVNTTYTFTATDTITSAKMNNIIDQTTVTDEAIIGTTLEVASGKLKVRSQGITSNEMAANSVTSTNIVDGTIVNADISPTAAIAGTKVSPAFGSQNISATGNLVLTKGASDTTTISAQNTSGVTVNVNAIASTEGNIRTATNHPLTLSTNNAERIMIESGGNVGIGTSTPGAKLEIKGNTVDDNNPELKISGSAGHLSTYVSLNTGGYNPIVLDQDKAIIFTEGTTETGNLVIAPHSSSVGGVRITSSGNVGIKKSSPSTALDVNGTVTATEFSGPLTGDVTGTATTVSNGAITAEKLNGAQGGSAPIFGVRAFVQFEGRNTNGNCTIRASGNVTSVARTAVGKYTVTFGTPMQSLYYAVTCSASSSNVARIACADRATATLSSIEIETYTSAGAADDFTENSVMIIE